MPIYEYECPKCGHATEALKKFSDPPLIDCELCGAKMKKLISHSTFHLKGSGWYVTDYASKSRGGPENKKTTSETASVDKPKETAEPSKKMEASAEKPAKTSSNDDS